MKKSRTVLRYCAALLLLVIVPGAASSQEVSVEASNPLDIPRPSETIEIEWGRIQPVFSGVAPASIVVFDTGKPLVSQTIDSDGDGVPDLLLFQSDFAALQKKRFIIREAAGQKPAASKTDARFVLPRQDLAWENDRIAFRIYGSVLAGDVNNGIDVWTKRVRSLVVEKWYRESEGSTPGKDSYHKDRGEGADFFSVGKSLGAGSCAILRDGKLWQPGLFATHKILAAGPIRALFEVTYDSGMVGTTPFREVKRISLDAGQNLNRIEVTYTGLPEKEPLSVACGVVRRKNVTAFSDSGGAWIALWGPTNEDTVNGSLGTGVVLPRAVFGGISETEQHLLAKGVGTIGKPFVYYAGAGWTRSGDFTSGEEWCTHLARFARRLHSPLKLRISTPAIPVIPRM